MTLSSGTRLGPYEVVAPLGAGGMGEVYRARDARIGRDVAVKVLPAALAQDEERLRRFEQEARAAGRLSHPNVLVVHDVGRHEGILYEMLSGRRAFAGDSSVETLNAILKEDPPELSATGRPLPPALDRIVRHCLEKSPDERFASARDLAFDLQALSDVSASAPAVAARPGVRRRVVAGLVGLALLALGALSGFLLGKALPGSAPSYAALTFRRGSIGSAVFTSDGKTVLYSAAWEAKPMEVFVTQPGSTESRPLGVQGWVRRRAPPHPWPRAAGNTARLERRRPLAVRPCAQPRLPGGARRQAGSRDR